MICRILAAVAIVAALSNITLTGLAALLAVALLVVVTVGGITVAAAVALSRMDDRQSASYRVAHHG